MEPRLNALCAPAERQRTAWDLTYSKQHHVTIIGLVDLDSVIDKYQTGVLSTAMPSLIER